MKSKNTTAFPQKTNPVKNQTFHNIKRAPQTKRNRNISTRQFVQNSQTADRDPLSPIFHSNVHNRKQNRTLVKIIWMT